MRPMYEFEKYEQCQYRDYRLPPQFWEAFLHFRNWVLENQRFVEDAYLEMDSPFARAWAMVDYFFDRIYQDEVSAGRL